ncbi:MAG TPA: CocE/NonD family hydrolase [Bryobacteraceae bacterium]|nr:CocE/NonD family hydrolase [Bryobacteraceae bacterium]
MRLQPIIALIGIGIAASATTLEIVKRLNVQVPMQDGVRLAANIFLPAETGRFPTILVRTPYNKGSDLLPNFRLFLEHGYAMVVEDARGRYESEGIFDPFGQEPKDGNDTLNWIAHQPWSDGKIGMLGGSYLGIVQWKAALLNNPHLKAIAPVVSGSDDYRDRYYSTGGAMQLGHRLLWISENLRAPGFVPLDFSSYVRTLPLRRADLAATGQRSDIFQKALDHPAYDAFWRAMSAREHIDQIHVPVFSVGGWYDCFVESDLAAFSALRRSSSVHRIVIGPWPHNMSVKFANADFGKDSGAPIRRMQIEWFDQWLKSKDTPIMSSPPAHIFVMGANRWRDEQEWPPTRAKMTSFYFASRGAANTLEGSGSLGDRPSRRSQAERFEFDPANPVPTSGGATCCNPKLFAWGPMDQRPVERRPDVLVFSTPPVREDLEVIGPVRVVLYAATSAPDTDFTAKLVDVFPDGEARNLTDGILRLRYRDSLEKPQLAVPGQIYELNIDAGVTSNVFLKGHRVRLEISSSNFPRFDRNPNTGRPIADETVLRKADQIIYHDRQHPSRMILPVIPN